MHNLGQVGENIACKNLEKKGFRIVRRNFRHFLGEIDIIAEKSGTLHFVEVKTVSCEILKDGQGRVSRENLPVFSPEENVTPKKIERLKRAISVYFAQNETEKEKDWQFDIAAVFVDKERKRAILRLIEAMTI